MQRIIFVPHKRSKLTDVKNCKKKTMLYNFYLAQHLRFCLVISRSPKAKIVSSLAVHRSPCSLGSSSGSFSCCYFIRNPSRVVFKRAFLCFNDFFWREWLNELIWIREFGINFHAIFASSCF